MVELIVYFFDTGREEMAADTFPAGLRVLAVEHDRVCRKVLERQLQYCNYNGVFLASFAAPISPIPS
jgi:hypothetical protein